MLFPTIQAFHTLFSFTLFSKFLDYPIKKYFILFFPAIAGMPTKRTNDIINLVAHTRHLSFHFFYFSKLLSPHIIYSITQNIPTIPFQTKETFLDHQN